MRFFDLLFSQKPTYVIIYLLLLLHFVGGTISNIAILITSLWVFYYIIFIKNWDFYLIFLLILATIVFSSDMDSGDTNGNGLVFSSFRSVWIIGPFALSSAFMMALAIPFRLLKDFSKTRFKFLTVICLVNLIFAAIGLTIAAFSGVQNPSGLTVGLRITLTIGAAIVSRSIVNRNEFINSVERIIILTFILLILGLIRAHWIFIAFGFVPYFWYKVQPKILRIIPFFFAIYVFYNLNNTLTIIGILFFTILFYLLISQSFLLRKYMSNKFIILFIAIIPILITVYTIGLNNSEIFDLTTLKGFAEFKLIGDRKPIWDASWENIWASPFFVKPAGGQLMVYFDYARVWKEWSVGSHNIFLEIGRQIGAFSMISISVLLIVFIFKVGSVISKIEDLILFYCFISIYLVFGLTGQSLVYDGVGALFWLLFGQFYQGVYSEVRTKDFNS